MIINVSRRLMRLSFVYRAEALLKEVTRQPWAQRMSDAMPGAMPSAGLAEPIGYSTPQQHDSGLSGALA